MNTVIIISWWARTVTVFFTDIEGVYYTLGLGKVTSFRGARALIRREMLYKHGIALSRMKLEMATSSVYFLRANRIEKEC